MVIFHSSFCMFTSMGILQSSPRRNRHARWELYCSELQELHQSLEQLQQNEVSVASKWGGGHGGEWDMGVSINGSIPKWLVCFMENPIKMDD